METLPLEHRQVPGVHHAVSGQFAGRSLSLS